MRYAFIQEQARRLPVARSLPVRQMCQLLEVCPSGYYAWTGRKPIERQARQLELIETIRQTHRRSRGTYGSPRVHAELKKQGVSCSRKRVERLMRQEQIRSSRHKRFRVCTTDSSHGRPVTANVLDRQFEQSGPDQAWVTDITYVATDQGWLYLASVMDLFSRRIIGWATSDEQRTGLAAEALEMAIRARRPGEGLLHHSDRGTQYASEDYQALLERHGIRCSMSRSGNCWDNASMESFFKTFKVELVYQEHYATREEARKSIYEYIDLFYNRQRLHSSLGYRSPVEFENQWG